MRSRRVAASCAIALTVTLVASCTPSGLGGDEAVQVTGTLLDESGAPRPGVRTVLVKEADLGELLVGVPLAVGTLGLVCLADQAPAVCSKARRVTTGADGTFTFDLRGRETQGMLGHASTLHLSAASSAGPGDAGPVVAARFELRTGALHLPPLRVWAPRVTVSGPRVEWPPMDASYGSPATYAVSYSAGDPLRRVWTVEGPPPANVDPRVLEDSRGPVAVEASVTHDVGGTRVRVTSRSASVTYAGPAGPPPSRGAPCVIYTASGGTPSAPVSPCPLSDGDFSAPVGAPPDGATEVRTGTAVDLGRARSVSLVVVRGCPAECTVETSADGRAWVPAGVGSGAQVTVTPSAGASARWVRVRSATGLDVSRLAEISVW